MVRQTDQYRFVDGEYTFTKQDLMCHSRYQPCSTKCVFLSPLRLKRLLSDNRMEYYVHIRWHAKYYVNVEG